MRVTIWVDPVCPYTWNTACWATEASDATGDEIVWRPFSLGLKNGAAARPVHLAGQRALRTAAHLGPAEFGLWYRTIGAAIHWDSRACDDDLIAELAESTGLDVRVDAPTMPLLTRRLWPRWPTRSRSSATTSGSRSLP